MNNMIISLMSLYGHSIIYACTGGGIPMGKITEICGSAGTGKTQLCMQLAVDATIPVDFGGVGGHTLYIDTEGSMVVERLAQMARAAVKHITDVAENMDEEEGVCVCVCMCVCVCV